MIPSGVMSPACCAALKTASPEASSTLDRSASNLVTSPPRFLIKSALDRPLVIFENALIGFAIKLTF